MKASLLGCCVLLCVLSGCASLSNRTAQFSYLETRGWGALAGTGNPLDGGTVRVTSVNDYSAREFPADKTVGNRSFTKIKSGPTEVALRMSASTGSGSEECTAKVSFEAEPGKSYVPMMSYHVGSGSTVAWIIDADTSETVSELVEGQPPIGRMLEDWDRKKRAVESRSMRRR